MIQKRESIAVLLKKRKIPKIINDKEADRVMQMMVDEPIEGFDIFKALRKSKAEGREEGREEARKEGETKLLLILAGLVSDGILTVEVAAARSGLTVSEFKEKAGIE